eukprot:4995747-Amphidinium_carterae.1
MGVKNAEERVAASTTVAQHRDQLDLCVRTCQPLHIPFVVITGNLTIPQALMLYIRKASGKIWGFQQ